MQALELLGVHIRRMMSIRKLDLMFGGQKGHGDPLVWESRPRVTFVSGRNGAGKTCVLECIALLGHLPDCTVDDGDWVDRDVEAALQSSLIELLVRIVEPSQATGGSAAERRTLRVQFSPGEASSLDLTSILSVEDLHSNPFLGIRVRVRECSETGELSPDADDGAAYTYLSTHLSWSRPPFDDAQQPSERVRYLRRRSAPTPEELHLGPEARGFVGYLNTDMYMYGRGLDLRESPKALTTELHKVFVNRLALVEQHDGDDGFRAAMGVGAARSQWRRIFGPDRPAIRSLEYHVIHTEPSEPLQADETRLCVDGVEAPVQFLSSGENEILAVLLYLYGLRAGGSVILLDEPELHLSADALVRFYHVLYQFAELQNTQLVIVTHNPVICQFTREVPGVERPNKELCNFVWLEATNGAHTVVQGLEAVKRVLEAAWAMLAPVIDLCEEHGVPTDREASRRDRPLHRSEGGPDAGGRR